MSYRYRVEALIKPDRIGEAQIDFAVMDYCVDVGKLPKQACVFSSAIGAIEWAMNANKSDGETKAAFDARELETVSIQANRGTTFSMDVETHAKRYFIGPGGLAVYGSHQAIDTLRAKLNARYMRIQDLSKINATLRENLKTARAADDFKKRNEDMGNQLDAIRRQTLSGRFTSESIVDYIKRLQSSVATGGTNEALAAAQDEARMLRIQRDSLTRQLTRAEGDYSELKGAVIGLASNL